MAGRKSSYRKSSLPVVRTSGNDTGVTMERKSPAVHRFTRLAQTNDIPKGPADQGFAIAFTLNDMPNTSEFQALFDQYAIEWVEYTFVLKRTGAIAPVIYVAEDHDNDNLPSWNELLEKQSTQVLTFGADRTLIKYKFRPNPVRMVYNTAVANAYERAPNGTWLDCSYNTAKHYGLKYYIQNYNTATNPNCDIAVAIRYGLKFKEAQ